jgi:hypothetical protein
MSEAMVITFVRLTDPVIDTVLVSDLGYVGISGMAGIHAGRTFADDHAALPCESTLSVQTAS